MSVELVGSGPAAGAVRAAIEDVDTPVRERDSEDLTDPDLAVVVGQVGDGVFEQVNEHATAQGTRWLAVELGGVGGFPVTEASVAGFGPGSGCYECLSARVSANLDPEADPAAAPPAQTGRFAGAVAGRDAARYLSGGEAPFGQVTEIPHATREFLPLPGCTCAGDRDGSLDRNHVDRNLDESLARAERAIDERLGVVAEVGEAESFPAPYYLARVCDTAGFSDVAASSQAAGVAPGWDEAFMKALGEGFERYCAGVYRAENFEAGRPDDVSGAVPPSAFVCKGDPATGTGRAWVPGEHLATGETVHLPAEFVYHPPPSRECRPPTTTGLGLGNSGTEALLAGLTEVIERDATMLSWYSTFEPLGLSVSDPGFETLAARARSEDLSVTALLVTQDVDVWVVAAAVHREEWPAFALGSDAAFDPQHAARSALAEALQNWMELRGMGKAAAGEATGAIGRYAEFPPAAQSYVDPPSVVPAESVGPDEPPTGTDALERVVDAVDAAGLDAYGVRTTTRDVADLGFEAVRVLVPEAQPLFFGEAYFGHRAESVPESLGFEPALDRDHHPFP
ncbi:bacteriocin biosynthesis protein SagD [Halobacteriales archaeon SW_10_68_16]|jgi:ribosomal protein S12 methylthiotransferase accessory factor|nr:MAG: bacteriocin biosynthesis protein SagD [Halobacteriales archaeon SW_10_68_16]